MYLRIYLRHIQYRLLRVHGLLGALKRIVSLLVQFGAIVGIYWRPRVPWHSRSCSYTTTNSFPPFLTLATGLLLSFCSYSTGIRPIQSADATSFACFLVLQQITLSHDAWSRGIVLTPKRGLDKDQECHATALVRAHIHTTYSRFCAKEHYSAGFGPRKVRGQCRGRHKVIQSQAGLESGCRGNISER
jgi:hypothetical protein